MTTRLDPSAVRLLVIGVASAEPLRAELLRAAFQLEAVGDLEAAKGRLCAGGIDVAVLRDLPPDDALEGVRVLRSAFPATALGIVVLLPTPERARTEALIEAGANDCMREPLDETLLTARIVAQAERTRAAASTHRVSERYEADAQERAAQLLVANAELTATRAKLEAALSALWDGFALFDAEDRLVLSNASRQQPRPKWAYTYREGLTFEDIYREQAQDGAFPDALGREEQWLAERLERHRNPAGPVDQQLSDGRVIRVYEFRTADGGTITVRRDVTQEVATDRQLQEARRRQEALLTALPDALLEMRRDGTVIGFRAAEPTWFPGAEPVVGKRIQELLPEPLAAQMHAAIDSAHAEQRVRQVEFALDGRHCEARLVPLQDEEVLAILRDVTARKESERAADAQRRLLAQVLDALPFWISVKDHEGRYQFVNHAMAEGYGQPAAAFLGQLALVSIELHPERNRMAELDGQVLATGAPAELAEYEVRDAEGATRIRRICKFPLRDGEGAVSGVVSWSEDITDRLQAEQELRQAHKMEAVGMLTSGLAHEFNNLLQIIQGYGQIAARDVPEDSPVQAHLRQVTDATGRAADLARKLLAFSRSHTARQDVVDLNALVVGMGKMLRVAVGERIEVEVQTHASVPVEGDAGMLEQVVLNLALNARDAMPLGGTLSIRTGEFDASESFAAAHGWARAGRCATLTVADTGVGVPLELRERIFEPFFTTKGADAGTGLGLSTVFGIVEQHHGHVAVDSELGVGTTFTVYLPATLHDKAEREATSAPAPAAARGETVLVAENAPDLLELVTTLLEDQGYTVLTAQDGREACEVFAAHKGEIDLLVFDVIMPKATGPEAWELLQEQGAVPPVLFITGYSADALSAGTLQKDRVHLLRKPFSPDQLQAAVREALD